MDLTFYITIAGMSSRMGSDKAKLILGRNTFLQWMTLSIKNMGYQPILITKKQDNTKYDVRSIPDYNPQIGPLGGLYQSLLHSATSYVCYLSCDIPMLPVQVLQSLMNQAANKSCVIVGFKDSIYPLIGIYHKSVLPVITEQIQNENYKMMDFLQKINIQIHPVDAWIDDEILLNCNKSQDLERLRAYFYKEHKSPD